jgi:hypothetical protein
MPSLAHVGVLYTPSSGTLCFMPTDKDKQAMTACLSTGRKHKVLDDGVHNTLKCPCCLGSNLAHKLLSIPTQYCNQLYDRKGETDIRLFSNMSHIICSSKKPIKLHMCLIKHHTMMAYGKVKVHIVLVLHLFALMPDTNKHHSLTYGLSFQV